MADESPDIGDTKPHDTSDASPTPASPTPGDNPPAQASQDAESEDAGSKGSNNGDGVSHDEGDEEEDGDEGEEDEDEDEEDDEDEEPRLKYARLTQHLAPVYRNGDATSSFLVAGDKMIIGTHNGNIHVIQLPVFQTIRVYHAHSASVTSISISPYPPPLPTLKPEVAARAVAQATGTPIRPESRQSGSPSAATSRKPREAPQVPNLPSNNIHIATSSMDGNVCVQSLIDMKDVQLRNFARPVQAVALSPDYKNDRTYLSGGLAGNLILTVGGQAGRSTSTTVGTAAAASGWLGSMGLGTNTGKDTILHSGEGTISTIKWSLSGKYVAWINEHGIWIMRTKLHLESADADDAWKRIGHIDRPQTDEWETMASVWKGRAEWIDEQSVEAEDAQKDSLEVAASPAAEKLKQQQDKGKKQIERLLVGWGSTIWIINVHPGDVGVGKHVGERSAGRAEIMKILRMDCIISGISLYTQNLLLVLAYTLPDEEEEGDEAEEKAPVRGHKSKPSTASSSSEPSGGIRRRQNNQPPELRLIDLVSQAEVDKDGLSVSRFERLSSGDYHLGVLPQHSVSAAASSRGALEALAGLGTDMWNAAINPKALFSSGASIKSRDSGDAASSTKVASTTGSLRLPHRPAPSVHPNLAKPGIKIFIHSPYDCILATKRDLGDHLGWLLEHQEYQRAWELVNEHPEIVSTSDKLPELQPPSTPDKSHPPQQVDDFYEDTASTIDASSRSFNSSAEREKRRIGELWMQELIEAGNWTRAGQVAGKVIESSDRWEKWVYTFAGSDKFDEIVNYMPTEPLRPPIRSTIYEVVLGHYIQTDKPRFRELLDRWGPDLFDLNTVSTALENQLKFRDVREDSVEDGERGRDWRIVMECLAKLHEANGRHREALRCYIRLQDADSAMRLIKDSHLADAVADDIPSFIALRVPSGRVDHMSKPELEEATSEAVTLLVDEAQHGLVRPEVVVSQLQERKLNLYLFFYLRALWKGEGIQEHMGENRDRLVMDSKTLVDDFADLAVHLFAVYDQPILMDFLKTSTSYAFEKAVQECESHNYVPELVYLYAKTGQMKRALYLIIDRLGDVSQAIAFAKEQDDPDLWEDLLKYSMDKPRFIRGLLEEVGTAINPIILVRRIPEGLEIEGLREGLKHIMKEHEIQYSISEGVARVLRSEVAEAQSNLRNGQRKGIKFEVAIQSNDYVDIETKDVPTPKAAAAGVEEAEQEEQAGDDEATDGQPKQKTKVAKKYQPGHCVQCNEPFAEWETETLVGFACGHVFHLTHLLEFLHPGEPVDIDFGFGSEDRPGRNVIGTKVTHARLLKDRIMGGCPVCTGQKSAAV